MYLKYDFFYRNWVFCSVIDIFVIHYMTTNNSSTNAPINLFAHKIVIQANTNDSHNKSTNHNLFLKFK